MRGPVPLAEGNVGNAGATERLTRYLPSYKWEEYSEIRSTTVKITCPLSVCLYELENPVIDPKKCPGCQRWIKIDASRAGANNNQGLASPFTQRESSGAENIPRHLQDYRTLANATYNKGAALLHLDDPAGADEAFARAAEYFRDIGASSDEADALEGSGDALTRLGFKERARELYIRAHELRSH